MAISDKSRRILWGAAGGFCAMPDCNGRLVEPTPDQAGATVLAQECHIVPQRDHPSVARSLPLLSEDERRRQASLIDDRDHHRNLVLMCLRHAKQIDDPAQGFSVDDLLTIKAEHQAIHRRPRAARDAAQDALTAADFGALLASVEDADDWDRKARLELVRNSPADALWLDSELGDPLRTKDLERLIRRWPPRIADGPFELGAALVRRAERYGRHDLASIGWERLADRATGPTKADRLARAAISAKVSDNEEREHGLLARAEAEDPAGPRVQLQRVDENLPAVEILTALEPITADDDALQAQIELHRALANLRLPDRPQRGRTSPRRSREARAGLDQPAQRHRLHARPACAVGAHRRPRLLPSRGPARSSRSPRPAAAPARHATVRRERPHAHARR